jgi:hypothetical protein
MDALMAHNLVLDACREGREILRNSHGIEQCCRECIRCIAQECRIKDAQNPYLFSRDDPQIWKFFPHVMQEFVVSFLNVFFW